MLSATNKESLLLLRPFSEVWRREMALERRPEKEEEEEKKRGEEGEEEEEGI